MKHFFYTLAFVLGFNTFVMADTLTIIHVNDTHSNLAPGGRRDKSLNGSIGGIARAASVIGEIKATNANVLTLHAGDIYIGDLFFQKYYGVAELQLMSSLGFDAMTVGNHEFDLTPAVLQQALDTAFVGGQTFPLLSANTNLDDPGVAGLRKYIKAFSVHNVNGMKVGIFGLTTPATNILSLPAPAVIDTNIVPIAIAMVDSLRKLNCKVIICLSHLGVSGDAALAENVDGIDLIVGGHDHYLFNSAIKVKNNVSGRSIPIVQAGSAYYHVGEVKLSVANGKVEFLSNRVIALTDQIPEAAQVKSMVDLMIADIESTYGKVYTEKIAEADADFDEVAEQPTKLGNQDTPIGNLVSDAYRTFGGTDIGIQPGGSTAQMLYKGALVAADAFRVSGYGFNTSNGLGYRMATCKLKGQDIIAGIEFGLASIEENDEYMLQVSGMSYSYNPTAAPFQRVLSAKVGKDAIVPDKVYSLCINEFVVAFLSFVNIVPTDVEIHGDTTEFQVLAGYIAANQKIQPYQDGRISASASMGVAEQSSFGVSVVSISPNPASDHVNMRLTLDEAQTVRVVIYDTRLREVREAYNDRLSAGEQHIALDTSMLSPGSYFYKCYYGDHQQVGVLVVSR